MEFGEGRVDDMVPPFVRIIELAGLSAARAANGRRGTAQLRPARQSACHSSDAAHFSRVAETIDSMWSLQIQPPPCQQQKPKKRRIIAATIFWEEKKLTEAPVT